MSRPEDDDPWLPVRQVVDECLDRAAEREEREVRRYILGERMREEARRLGIEKPREER